MWFDTHCHVHDTPDPKEALQRARAAGVTDVVSLGIDVEQSEKALALARDENVWAGAAWHPTSVKGWQDSWSEDIDRLLADERVVAVGETGLDLYWDTSFFDDQVNAFKAHIDLAKEHGKALVIHTRNSVDEAMAVLEEVGPPGRLVFHCWSGDEFQAARALCLGAMVSFAGNVSFKSAAGLRSVAKSIPSDRLLIETDSPYLTPEPNRGKPNEPAFVVHVGEAVAQARGVTSDEIASTTRANAYRLFGLD